ncbi:MAG: hypothetical protein MUE98_15150 [Rhodobacteraceae bacterium]|jgi:uncharacterized protein YjiS (DUF1127 family)|nr:hypothetical protein [Paracoccaceae bacterium]
MSISDVHAGHAALAGRIAAFWSRLGAWGESYLHHMSRVDQIRRLEAKSDAELAELGLSRQAIVQHVFRDRMGM